MGITEEDILSWVRAWVWTGKYDAEEVAGLLDGQLGEGDQVDEGWLEEVIEREFAAKREAEKTWPAVTDCDRLDRAFTILSEQGVIALQIAGFTQSDGLEDVAAAYQDPIYEKSEYVGHCFFTEQDQQGALDGRGLCIGFGHLSGKDAQGVAAGEMLRTALEREGFEVEWDGTIRTRLFIKGFRWQRRGP